jgi:hypothetical protein
MNNSDLNIKYLEALLNAYIRLNALNAEPGNKAYMLSQSIKFIRTKIHTLLKELK